MLEGKMTMPSLEVGQALTKPSTNEGFAKFWTKLATKAIVVFDESSLQYIEPSLSSDAPLAREMTYLVDIAARPTWECQNLRFEVVQLTNGNNVLVVGHTGSNPTQTKALQVILDSDAQLVMIGKWLTQELGLIAWDLDPSPFTIFTSLGGTKHASYYTKQPLQLIFYIGCGPLQSHLSLECAVTTATNYDILIGQ